MRGADHVCGRRRLAVTRWSLLVTSPRGPRCHAGVRPGRRVDWPVLQRSANRRPARSIARSVRRSHLSQQRRRPRVGARSARSCGTRFWTGTGLNPGGGTFGPDCRYYLGLRSRRRILGWPPPLTAARNLFCPMVSSRSRAGSALPATGLYLASGIGPAGEGDNTRRVQSRRNSAHTSLGRRCRVQPARPDACSEWPCGGLQ